MSLMYTRGNSGRRFRRTVVALIVLVAAGAAWKANALWRYKHGNGSSEADLSLPADGATYSDSGAGLQFRRAAIEQGRAQCHREFAVTLRGQHAEPAAVPAIALFVVGIQPGLGGCGGKAADGR